MSEFINDLHKSLAGMPDEESNKVLRDTFRSFVGSTQHQALEIFFHDTKEVALAGLLHPNISSEARSFLAGQVALVRELTRFLLVDFDKLVPPEVVDSDEVVQDLNQHGTPEDEGAII